MTITTSTLTRAAETIDLYYGHARDGRAALWIHYGHRRQSDFYLQRPTS